MWVAIRPFKYRGKRYEAGDEVPASGWPTKRALEARRRIRYVKPDPKNVSKAQLRNMSRAELNTLAEQLKMDEPTSYPNRESLIVAIKEELGMEADPVAPDDVKDDSELMDEETEETTVEVVVEEKEDLGSGASDESKDEDEIVAGDPDDDDDDDDADDESDDDQ